MPPTEVLIASRRTATAGLAALVISAPSVVQGKPDVQQAVEAFVMKFEGLHNKKDAVGPAALYADDGVLVPPGPIATGKQSIETMWQAVLYDGRTGLKYKVQQAREDGDVAWSAGQFSVMVSGDKGVPRERQGNFSQLHQWQGDEPKLRVRTFNFLPPR